MLTWKTLKNFTKMKKILLHTAAVLISTILFTSCRIDSPQLFYSYMTAVKEQPSDKSISYLVTDDSTIVYPTEWFDALSRMKHNQRLLATFTVPSGELGDRIEASFQSYGYVSEDSIKVTSQPDTLGKDPVSITEAWHSGGIYGAGRFVTVSFVISGAGLHSHSVILVDNSGSVNPDVEGYWNLTLRHNANGDPQGYQSQAVYSFPLPEQYTASGIKGLRITYQPLNSTSAQTVTVPYAN